MAKLTFRYGTTGSGKSLLLCSIAYNYIENGMEVLILTSKIDNRYGHDLVKSRAGVQMNAIGLDVNDDIIKIVEYKKSVLGEKLGAVLVDEVQFLSKEQIYQLTDVVDDLNIPVICFGLRGDFKIEPFNASSVLMTIADSLEEVKTICSHCKEKKATISARYVNGKVQKSGKQIEIGGNEKYKPLCRKCWKKLTK
mgnify:CR=1 FL=1